MKKTFFIISFVIIFGALYLAYLNFGNNFDLTYLFGTQNSTMNFNIGIYTIFVLFLGIFAGSGFVYMFLDLSNQKVNAYKRELEKTMISGQSSSSKAEVLEAKIKTLEKAFETVADERTQMELKVKQLNDEIKRLSQG